MRDMKTDIQRNKTEGIRIKKFGKSKIYQKSVYRSCRFKMVQNVNTVICGFTIGSYIGNCETMFQK